MRCTALRECTFYGAKSTMSSLSIFGTSARNNISGLNTTDYIYAGVGDDIVYGNGGDDIIYAGVTTPVVNSRLTDNDWVYAGDGNDRVYGGYGNDVIYGGAGNDRLWGESGHDYLNGGIGNDIIDGGLNNDYLEGGIGNDTLIGGLGADKFVFRRNEGIDIIKDFNWSQGDRIAVNRTSFGATSVSQFRYNAVSGAVSFGNQIFAIVENKPTSIGSVELL